MSSASSGHSISPGQAASWLPVTLAWLVAVLPVMAAAGSYFISASNGQVPWCWPMLEGCTSISRAARTEPAIFWFRLLMLPNAALLLLCWWLTARWLRQRSIVTTASATRWMVLSGVIGALALALYVDFLGSSGATYQFMRRFGITFYFAGTGLAQLLTLRLLRQQFLQRSLQRPLQQASLPPTVLPLLWYLVVAQWLLAMLHVVLKSTLPDYDQWENRLEWTLALLLTGWFAVLAEQWRRERLTLLLTTRSTGGTSSAEQ